MATFGKTSIGSTSYPEITQRLSNDQHNGDFYESTIHAVPITLVVSGLVTKVGFRAYGTESVNVRVAIYADSGGEPGSLLGESGSNATSATGWQDFELTTPASVTAGVQYWLGWQTSAHKNIYYTWSGTHRYKASTPYGAFPSSWPAGSDSHDDNGLDLGLVMAQITAVIKSTKATLSETAVTVNSVSFYCHVASGSVRVAIYDPSKNLLWQSGSVAALLGWLTVNISAGTPTSLVNLPLGTYYLLWQYTGSAKVPSYTLGASGDGFYKVQAYGSFPSSISGETSSSETWSMYVTYSVEVEEEEQEGTVLLSEGINCHVIDAVFDYRQIATVVILKAGKDENGADIVVTVSDEEAVTTYGRLVLPFSESQWNTQLLAELRANQLLSISKQPIVTISVDALDCFVKRGYTATLVSSTLGLNTTYLVDSAEHIHDEGGPTMGLQLRNRTPSIVDFLTLLQRNLEKR